MTSGTNSPSSRTPILETPRLLLRRPAPEDFEPWAAFLADEETARFIGGVQGRELAWRSVALMAGAWEMRGYAMFSVIEKSTGQWVGRLGPWKPEGWPAPEIGWGIRREYWGRGYATEGAAAAMDYAFDMLGWDSVIHAIAPENRASIAVALHLGSKLQGRAQLPPPLEHVTADLYGQSRAEWADNRARLAQR